jgi:adenosylmethionine-8-amino-7-oxononanoate aminotransferase
MSVDELRKQDLHYLWHPYTHINTLERTAFPIIKRAQGVYLHTVDERLLFDGISSWWCVNLGHSHPRLIQALIEQSQTLQHSMLGGLSHPTIISLTQELLRLTPSNLQHVMWASDGSSSVEAALKVALQYWQMRSKTTKTRFISLEGGYHGDTLGALNVGYIEAFHRNFKTLLRPAYKAPSPHCVGCDDQPGSEQPAPTNCSLKCFNAMAELLYEKSHEVAAVIVEPLCQAASGMRIYPAAYLKKLAQICRELDVLLIVDEIATGFGRTGTLFACEQAGIKPDLLTIGKGLTAGYLPMSGLLVTDEVYNSFRDTGGEDRTFYHGHTFGGNPLAAAVALAALKLYQEPHIISNLKARTCQLKSGMEECGRLLANSPVQSLGLISKIHINARAGGAKRAEAITTLALEYGLFTRPLGEVIYLWPPLTTTENELAGMLILLQKAVQNTMVP